MTRKPLTARRGAGLVAVSEPPAAPAAASEIVGDPGAPPTGFIPWRGEAMAFWLPDGVSASQLGIAPMSTDPAPGTSTTTRNTNARERRP